MADVTLPQLGETVTEGTITQWFKSVGDTVAADEPLFEVSTDKVDTEVPSPVSGVLTEIRVPEGDTVDVGTVIAVVGDSDAAAAPAPAEAPSAPEATAAPAASDPAEADAPAEAPPVTESTAPAEAPAPAEAAPAGAARARRTGGRGAPATTACRSRAGRGRSDDRQPAAVAGGPPARQRTRPRSRRDHRHRPGRAHHP